MFDWILNISLVLEIDTIIKFLVRNNLFVDNCNTWSSCLGGWAVFEEKEKGNFWPHLTLTPDPLQQLVVSFSQMSWIYVIR